MQFGHSNLFFLRDSESGTILNQHEKDGLGMGKKDDLVKKDNDYQEYRQDREATIKAENEQSSSFDKYLLTLSGGTFGITITFIKNIIGTEKTIVEGTKWLLYSGWGFLVLSICCTLFSFRTSIAGYRWLVNKMDDEQRNPDCSSERKNHWSSTTEILNTTSVIAFILGSMGIFMFVIGNL